VKNCLQTKKQFKEALKEFLHFHSFYSVNEFYNYNNTQNVFKLLVFIDIVIFLIKRNAKLHVQLELCVYFVCYFVIVVIL
jgi:hypothetical protein